MALALTLLGTPVASGANATTYTHGSVTPTGGAGIIVVVANDKASAANLASLDVPTWLDGSWTQEADVIDTPTGIERLTVFSGKAVSSPGADNLTASFGGLTQIGCFIVIFEVTGQDTTDFVLQPKTDLNSSATSFTITLDNALAAATSVVVGIFQKDGSGVYAPSGGETELTEQAHATPVRALVVQHKVNDTSTGTSWTGTDYVVGVAFELVEAGAVQRVLQQPCNHQNPGVLMRRDDRWNLRDRIWLPNFRPERFEPVTI